MVRTFSRTVAWATAFLMSGLIAQADEPIPYDVVSEDDSSLFAVEAPRGFWNVNSEILLLQPNTAAGTRTDNAFDLDTAARFSLGYTTSTGTGARATFFDYDHSFIDAGVQQFSLDTYSVDFEIYKKLDFSQDTSFEVNGGVRYLNAMLFWPTPFEPNNFDGWGVFVGGRGATVVGTGGSLYARGKFAILTGDGFHDANALGGLARQRANDVGRTQFELGVGYEHPFELGCCLLTPSIGLEAQNWGSGFLIDVVDEHPEGDFVLAGFVIGLDVAF